MQLLHLDLCLTELEAVLVQSKPNNFAILFAPNNFVFHLLSYFQNYLNSFVHMKSPYEFIEIQSKVGDVNSADVGAF